MVMALVNFVLIALCAFLLYVVNSQRKELVKLRPKAVTKPTEPVKKVDYYGHPWNIVGRIRNLLPDVSYPFAWETQTQVLENGHVVLVVALRNLQTDKEIDRTSVRLTKYSEYSTCSKTWETAYTLYASSSKELKAELYNDHVAKSMDPIKLMWRRHTQQNNPEDSYRMQA